MNKSVKFSGEQLSQLIGYYQEQKEQLNAEMQELKEKVASVSDMIKQLQEAQGAAAAVSGGTESKPAPKTRGRKKGSTAKAATAAAKPKKASGRAKKSDADKTPRVSFATKILESIQQNDRAMNAAELFEQMAETESGEIQESKYKQNIHSNLNNLYKKGALKRIKDDKTYAYGLAEWFGNKGEIDQMHAPIRNQVSEA
ncbi:hypothetical protein SAMN05421823_103319 [Catalinimonas alkaloidigena]|uniref:Uncharacterized protein n=1 Tax=Catalinimonas alkaloidigena TaxID=1075417 RepID=A0A1G9E1H4_9BACT|nr:hypothetical protein [Catalinimonas alkaloidigena]SDK69938.1 hypothetical protein SAMN05421823_103319 [Catalinimonas alkaloidigena]